MSVLDKLPDGELGSLLHDLDEMGSQIKGAQTVGSSGVITNAVQSQATSDITIPASDARDVLFQFTPSDLAFGGGLAFRLYYSVNGGDYREVNPSFRLPVGSDNVQSWRILGGNGSSSSVLTMKFILVCIGSGTFSCSLVS